MAIGCGSHTYVGKAMIWEWLNLAGVIDALPKNFEEKLLPNCNGIPLLHLPFQRIHSSQNQDDFFLLDSFTA